MRKIFMAALISSCAFAAMPVAAAGSGSMAYYETRIDNVNIPHILDNDDKYYFSTLFQAIDNANWTVVQTMLAEREGRKDQGIIYHMARAEYYLAPTSPRIAMNDLLDLLYQAPDLPNGEQIANLAKKRGATILPELPQVQPMAHFAQISRRGKPGGVRDGSMPDHMARAIKDQIVADNPDGAYRLLLETDPASAMMPAPNGNSAWHGHIILRIRTKPHLIWPKPPPKMARANGAPMPIGWLACPHGVWAIIAKPPQNLI